MFLIADGVSPGSKEKSSVVRNLLKRASINSYMLGFKANPIESTIEAFVSEYGETYPILKEKKNEISAMIDSEHKRVSSVLELGFEKLKKLSQITPRDIFDLHQSHGFDVEYARPILNNLNIEINWAEVENYLNEHSDKSRAGAEQKFKGGLADHSEMSVKYHTATHLLHQALRDVLGASVYQKGSNITPERLRFDFSFDRKLTDEEKKKVEDMVNQKITEALPVSYEDIPLEEAKKRGAIGLFEEKYGDKVRVYKVGEYSLEFCGGPHVGNTSELGHFKIVKEEAVSQGIRRIKAVLA